MLNTASAMNTAAMPANACAIEVTLHNADEGFLSLTNAAMPATWCHGMGQCMEMFCVVSLTAAWRGGPAGRTALLGWVPGGSCTGARGPPAGHRLQPTARSAGRSAWAAAT